jgi:hypothetical protein
VGERVNDDYPVRVAVEYPDRDLNRLTTAFRIFTVIPIAILLASIGGSSGGGGFDAGPGGTTTTIVVGGTGLLFLPPLLMILFRQKYPRWWFDWNLERLRFTNRVGIYLALMNDRYPSTDEQQSVRLDFDYPDARQDLNRWLPIVKWFLAIPHYVVLFFLYIGAVFAVIAAWFVILFTGRYPRGIFDYVEGVARWHNRVVGYAFILVTDHYPPFRLAPLSTAARTAALGGCMVGVRLAPEAASDLRGSNSWPTCARQPSAVGAPPTAGDVRREQALGASLAAGGLAAEAELAGDDRAAQWTAPRLVDTGWAVERTVRRTRREMPGA